MFPQTRLRRLRRTPKIRRVLQENQWDFEDLIVPFFVVEGEGKTEAIPAMPGIYRYSLDRMLEELESPLYQRVGGIILFGVPSAKDPTGTEAYRDDGIVQRACRMIKERHPDLLLITDLCLCAYTSHGHCGLLKANGEIDNDRTLEVLGRIAVSQAAAGADVIAPSDMMDGRVGFIRHKLDEAGFNDRLILSYSAKFASAFYDPFREAASSAPVTGDRRSYQLPPANRREALRELAEDVAEGTDWLMVKPALCYLDIIREARERFELPLVAYNVSGEYAMVKAAAERGWVDERHAVNEIMLSLKRAGADLIITYHAKDLFGWRQD